MNDVDIYIGSDHHGVAAKESIIHYLATHGYTVHDIGTNSAAMVDYPDIALAVARPVSEKAHKRRGILLCGTGIGVCMVANRFAGVLAGQVWNEDMARRASADDRVNVLCLSADYLSPEQCALFVDIWLKTPFSETPRYIQRLEQVAHLDQKR